MGNLIDRVLLGHVVDFISLHYEHRYWPAFNLADSAITLGAGWWLIDAFWGALPPPKKPPYPDAMNLEIEAQHPRDPQFLPRVGDR